MKTYTSKDLHSKDHITTLIRGSVMLAIILAGVVCIKLGMLDKYLANTGIGNLSEKMTGVYIIAACLAGIFLLINLDNFIMSKKYEKAFVKLNEEELVEQIQNHLIHVEKSGKKPIFFTEKYLISVNTNIIPMEIIDWLYVTQTKNGPLFKLFTLEGKEVATGISGYNKHAKACTEAIIKANPKVLTGYSSDNETLHKKHVSEFKKRK